MGIHRHDLPRYLVPVRAGAQRAADLLLRHWRRLEARHPVQGRRVARGAQ